MYAERKAAAERALDALQTRGLEAFKDPEVRDTVAGAYRRLLRMDEAIKHAGLPPEDAQARGEKVSR